MDKLTINESTFSLKGSGTGKIAVFMYLGENDPKKTLDWAVHIYVQDKGYHELIDSDLNNPWMRVVISDINAMDQREFNPATDRL